MWKPGHLSWLALRPYPEGCTFRRLQNSQSYHHRQIVNATAWPISWVTDVPHPDLVLSFYNVQVMQQWKLAQMPHLPRQNNQSHLCLSLDMFSIVVHARFFLATSGSVAGRLFHHMPLTTLSFRQSTYCAVEKTTSQSSPIMSLRQIQTSPTAMRVAGPISKWSMSHSMKSIWSWCQTNGAI